MPTMRFDFVAADRVSAVASKVSQSFDKVGDSVDKLDRKTATPKVTADTRAAHTELDRLADKGDDAGKKMGDGVSRGFASGIAKVTAVGVAALGVFLKGAFTEAAEAVKVSALTAQAIKSIGAESWTSAEAVGALSERLSNKIGVDDELIQSSANLLLSFSNIRNAAGEGNAVFDRATLLTQDLAARGFGDADTAAKMLGKALNDPLKGLTALGKAGVQFTQEQKDQIAALVKSGDVLGAQKIILGEVERQVGGAAEASTTAAQKMGVAWGNIQEKVGLALMPALQTVFEFVTNNFPIIAIVATGLGVAMAAAWLVALGPVGWVIAAITAVVAAVVWAWTNFEGFRNVVTAVWEAIRTATSVAWEAIQTVISFAWNSVIKPVVDGLVTGFNAVATAVTWLWETVIQPVFNFIAVAAKVLFAIVATVVLVPLKLAFDLVGFAVMALWNNAIQPAWAGISAVISAAWTNVIQPAFAALVGFIQTVIIPVALFLWQNVIQPVWAGISAAINFAWQNVILPVFNALRAGLDFIGQVATALWQNVIQPVFNGIGAVIRTIWENVIQPAFNGIRTGVGFVADAFQSAVGLIGRVWDTLKGIVLAPVKFVVDIVYNKGIVPVWNFIAGIFDLGKLQTVSFAQGGITPGYTPGRDVHQFWSPTAGGLELSGGEAVMRPEWTRAVGSGWVAGANAAARTGGVAGAQRYMSDRAAGYASGGIIGRFAPGGILPSIADFTGKLLTEGPVGAITSLFGGATGDAGNIPKAGLLTKALFQIPGKVVSGAIEAAKKWIASLFTRTADIGAVTGGGGIGGSPGGGGWQWQMSVLRAAFPGLALISGYRPGAVVRGSGNQSYHAIGRAVDVPPRMDVFNWISAMFGRNTKELIFTPAGGRQLLNGRPYVYTGAAYQDHFNHVHWAFGDGGIVRRPTFGLLGEKGPEAVVPLSRGRSVLGQAGLGGDMRGVEKRIDQLIDLLERRGAGAQITVEDRSGDPVATARSTQLALRTTF